MISFHPIHSTRWISIFFTISIIILGSVYCFNYVIDPFGERAWIIEKRYKPIVYERSEKYNYIFNQKNIQHFNCLILGSSRVMKISPLRNEEIKECYNFGVSMASNNEKLFLLTEWLKYKKLSTVYLDVDFLNLHRDVDHPEQTVKSHFTQGNEGNYLSTYTLKMSIKSLKNSIHNQPETFFESDGSINYFNDDSKIKDNTFNFTTQRYIDMANFVHHEQFIKKPFVYSPLSLKYLKQIKQICDKNHINLVVFIPPEYTKATKKILADPLLQQYYIRYKSDLVSLFGTVYDFSGNFPENRDTHNFYDTWHYRDILADKVAKRLHGSGEYGSVLTKNNLKQNWIYFQTNFKED
jgi:hypothetical protein